MTAHVRPERVPPNPRFAKEAPASQPLMIQPTRGWVDVRLADLWEYRELLYFLVWRDIKVRYKQTVLGVAWAVIQPVFAMIVFSVFFGHFARMPSDGLPYPVFAYCGLLPWQLFSHALTESSNSLVVSQNLITKVYFPRLVIPLATVLAGLVDFAISFVVLLALMAAFGTFPTIAILVLPLFVALVVACALAVGLWLSALNVQYRDIRFTIPFLAQLWFFATPVVYPSSLLPQHWRLVLTAVNPMAGVVEAFRWALLGTSNGPGWMVAVSTLIVAGGLLGGLYYFRRMERRFADFI